MAQDDKLIGYISPAELANLMRETGMISVQETATVEGKPVIHALLKVVNAETGLELPGGLPFSVVMFKGAAEPGCSNIAIGTVVPAAELGIVLPADFFNLCNQRFRFVRAFPLDASMFVLQMDLFVRSTTQEYVKFSFGLWAALFSQVLFELMGRGTQSLSRAAEVYAAAPVEIIGRYADAIASDFEPLAEEAPVEAASVEAVVEPIAAADESEPSNEAVITSEEEASVAPTPSAENECGNENAPASAEAAPSEEKTETVAA